jgi:hypothetical protein
MTEVAEQDDGDLIFDSKAPVRTDRAEGIAAAARMYIADLHAGNFALPMAKRASFALDSFLEALARLCPDQETIQDRARWTVAARISMHEIVTALRAIDQAEPGTVPAAVLARAGAEAVRWDLVDRHAPDIKLWSWLGDLFVAAHGNETVRVAGELDTVAREYLRAIAYHAAALDQQTLKTGFAVAELIDLSLSFLLLVRENTSAALYGIDVANRGIPVRLAQASSFEGWSFVTIPAADSLSDIHAQLVHGQCPPDLEKIDPEVLCDAAAHLCRQWSASPPTRRFQRYPFDARLCVVCGYDQAMNLLSNDVLEEGVAMGTGAWRITDLSRGGVGAAIPSIRATAPAAGDLVAFCPEEGVKWHIGVVRRVRTSKTYIEIGIATLSDSPDLVQVDDGRAPRDLCFCDPIRSGEAVRLLGPVGALGDNNPFFVMVDGNVHKLRPLAKALRGKSFDLRVYLAA